MFSFGFGERTRPFAEHYMQRTFVSLISLFMTAGNGKCVLVYEGTIGLVQLMPLFTCNNDVPRWVAYVHRGKEKITWKVCCPTSRTQTALSESNLFEWKRKHDDCIQPQPTQLCGLRQLHCSIGMNCAGRNVINFHLLLQMQNSL